MKRSTNIISGVVVAVLALGYFGYRYSQWLVNNYEYYAYYDNIQGLQVGDKVLIKGVRVGKVRDIDMHEGRIRISILINKDTRLKAGTVAMIESGGLNGSRNVSLLPGAGPGLVEDEAVIADSVDEGLKDVSARITPMMETAKSILKTSDSTLLGISRLMNAGLLRSSTHLILVTDRKMESYSKLSAGLSKRSDGIVRRIESFDQTVRSVAAKDVNGTISEANQTMLEWSAKPIKQEVQELRTSITGLSKSLKRLNDAEDKLGKALNDKEDYNTITKQLDTLTGEMKELQKDPPGISIFGSSKKKKK